MEQINNSRLLQQYIKKFQLTKKFSQNMVPFMKLYYYPRGAFVCSIQTTLKNMYFLVEGKVKIYTILENGKSLLLRFNNPLSLLGDIEYLNDYLVRCNVETVCPSYLIKISFENLKKYAYDDPLFLRFVITSLSQKLYTISNSTSINLLYPLENRFASYLYSVSLDNENTDELRTSKLTEIAELLGTSYRHLNRMVRQFIQEKIIRRENGMIFIEDFNKLQELAKENLYE